MSGFAAHGKLWVDVDGGLVVVHAEGPFNLELTDKLAHGADLIIEQMRGRPWAVLIVPRGGFLLTPDAEQSMIGNEPRYEAAGKLATAFVIPADGWSRVAKSQWQRIYADNLRPLQFFDSQSEASEWLLAELSSAEPS